ncbi:MAG: DUF1292 domain-containing protein [Clostridia bacterium]|nr:DUF1292 domain-containing protein [Clostridia bacterium]
MNEEMDSRNMDEMDEDVEYIDLIDEEGNSETYEVLASFPMGEVQYVAVTEAVKEAEDEESETDEDEEIPVMLLRMETDEEGNDIFVAVDDDEEAEQAFNALEELLGDEEE